MKTLIALISLVATTAFAAQDFDSITEVSHTVAQVSSVDDVIASVSLNTSGVLVIRKHDKSMQTLKLSARNKENMLYTASMLSEAELQHDVYDVACAMMIDPRSVQNLKVYDSNTQEMRVVLSHRSCAIPEMIYPKAQHAMEAASSLKAQLTTLALQMAK